MIDKKVKAKFVCSGMNKRCPCGYRKDTEFEYDYVFSACTSSNSEKTEENESFWKYTPSGELKMSCISDDVFEVGESYYLSFEKCQKEDG